MLESAGSLQQLQKPPDPHGKPLRRPFRMELPLEALLCWCSTTERELLHGVPPLDEGPCRRLLLWLFEQLCSEEEDES